MKVSTAELQTHIQEAFTWLLPVSLIIVTFLILFFGISEQVGNLKAYNVKLATQVNDMQNDMNLLKGDVPVKSSSSAGLRASVIKDQSGIGSVKADYQKIALTGKTYWYFTFVSDKKLNAPEVSTVMVGDKKVLVYAYGQGDVSTSPFELIEYDTDSSKMNSQYAVVFVEGKLVIFNDFATEKSTDLKPVLEGISKSTSVGIKTKDAASSELTKL
jgi:hypothetical protein